jgi:hypothetical protein
MKRCSASSELSAGQGSITAMSKVAACADNLDLRTSICRKFVKGNIAKGIETPSQIIIIEVQPLCSEEDVHM